MTGSVSPTSLLFANRVPTDNLRQIVLILVTSCQIRVAGTVNFSRVSRFLCLDERTAQGDAAGRVG